MAKCSKCGNPVDLKSATYHKCRHSAVNKKYGEIICAACCTRCKYLRKEHLGLAKSMLAYSCGYRNDDNKFENDQLNCFCSRRCLCDYIMAEEVEIEAEE